MNIDFRHEPQGAAYRALVRYAAAEFPFCLLVVRPGMATGPGMEEFRARMKSYLIAELMASEWPGTRLGGEDRAHVLRYALNDEVASILLGSASSLYAWLQPDLPEDFCVLRADGSAWLTTVSHESDGYLTLVNGELEDLQRKAPELLHCLAI